jgi:hypothetical protein
MAHGGVAEVGGAAGQPNEVSLFCGDAIRDPVTEACDDGPGDDDDSCTPACEVRNMLLVADDGTERLSRRLGTGRHPVATSASGAAAVYTQAADSTDSLRIALLNRLGQRSMAPVALAPDLVPSSAANPVVVGLADGSYVAAWADLAQGSLDVVMRRVSEAGRLGSATLANSKHAGSQYDPDLIRVGDELVVAWTDGFDVDARTFSTALEPLSEERTLSTLPFAGRVALAAHDAGWAAAFREPVGVDEQLAVVLSDGTRFAVGPFAPAGPEERPALVSLDSSHLLSVFCSEVGGVARLRGVLLDAQASESVVEVSLAPTLAPYDADSTLVQQYPALEKLGSRVFLAWQTSSEAGDELGKELFVRELFWNADEPTTVRVGDERPLPIDWPRAGAQQLPALAAGAASGGALITLFEHDGLTTRSKVVPNLVFGDLPMPSLALATGTESP